MRNLSLVVGPLALVACADTNVLTIELAHGSESEATLAAELRELMDIYDLSVWIWTSQILIDEDAVPHSHPVLTLNTQHIGRERLLLSTFIHEQLHWYAEAHQLAVNEAIPTLREEFPTVPVGYPEGARSEYSTYLHLIVCYLEYSALQDLLGLSEAADVIRYWTKQHYRWIYRIVLERQELLAAVAAAHGLLPVFSSNNSLERTVMVRSSFLTRDRAAAQLRR